MRPRTSAVAAFTLAALAVGVAVVPVRAEQIHRHGFNGRQTVFVRGEANVRVDEVEHDISTISFKSQPSSEHFRLKADAAGGDAAFIHYYYDTPPAPISELLTAGLWVKANKSGIQLRARVVFPKEPDPANPQLPLTTLIVARKPYEKIWSWEKLTLDNVPDLLNKHLPVLQARIGRAVNPADAYIDRLVLNLYGGPGTVDVWVDDLDIGPVKLPEAPVSPTTGLPVNRIKSTPAAGAHGRSVDQRGGELLVDGRPFFFRSIRYSGTPLFVLRQAGFNSLWLPSDASDELLAETSREGWLVIPSLPLYDPAKDDANGYGERLSQQMKRFSGVDVLFWDLGGGRSVAQAERMRQTTDAIHTIDPKRPLGADLWDGFSSYSQSLDVVGAHRWPLFTSLDMLKYRDWLKHRKKHMAMSGTCFTWIQNHLPDWYLTTVLGAQPTDYFTDPIGPHPEQVRLLAYIAMACGYRGLGFWSDRYLADSHQGRDRLQGMALLNAEIDMLSPALLAVESDKTKWLPTSEPRVNAALLTGRRGLVLLPIWFGQNTQLVPEQGSVLALKVTVPLVPDGADPWRLTPAGIESLASQCKKGVGGTELTIPEFDYAAPIVFTNDREGLLIWWQDYVRKYGRLAARWALDMAAVEYEKVHTTNDKLLGMGVEVKDAGLMFARAAATHEEARRNFAAEQYAKAYQGALRAMRSLRVIMSEHFRQATITLDTPTASPYAVSFFTLPRHYELFHEIQRRKAAENLLPYGEFELTGHVPDAGVTVDTLPGWSARGETLDRVNMAAGIVVARKYQEKVEPRKAPKPTPGIWAPGREIHPPDENYMRPQPELGSSLLRLEVQRPEEFDKDGQKKEPSTAPLERTFVAAYSPPVRLPPGTLVRVSAWVKVPKRIEGSADGVLFYDDAGGEQLGVRVLYEKDWKQYHLYRIVPSSGQISVTLALTGIGLALFDNVAIEPLVPVDMAAPGPDPALRTASLLQSR